MGYWTKKFNNTWFGKAVDWISDRDQDIQSSVRNFIDYGMQTGENAVGTKVTNIMDNLTGETAQNNFLLELERDDTRYQRLMEDLAAAGINPSSIFGSSGGASPSNGVAGSVSSNIGALGSILAAVADSGLKFNQSERTEAETEGQLIENAIKSIDLAVKSNTALDKALADIANTTANTSVLNAAIDKYIAETNKINAEVPKAEYEAEKSRIEALLQEQRYKEALETHNTGFQPVIKLTSQQANTIGLNLVKVFGFKGSSEKLVGVEVPFNVLCKAAEGDTEALKIFAYMVGFVPKSKEVKPVTVHQNKNVEAKFKHK